jgi:hypothetical protein
LGDSGGTPATVGGLFTLRVPARESVFGGDSKLDAKRLACEALYQICD